MSGCKAKLAQFAVDARRAPEPASDIDTALVDSLKALDPNRPIREADIGYSGWLSPSSKTSPSLLILRLAKIDKFLAPDRKLLAKDAPILPSDAGPFSP